MRNRRYRVFLMWFVKSVWVDCCWQMADAICYAPLKADAPIPTEWDDICFRGKRGATGLAPICPCGRHFFIFMLFIIPCTKIHLIIYMRSAPQRSHAPHQTQKPEHSPYPNHQHHPTYPTHSQPNTKHE